MSKNNTLWSLIKKYKWRSVFFRYAIILLTTVVLPFSLITFFIFSKANDLSERHYLKSQSQIYEERITSKFSDIINTVYLTQNSFFQMPALQNYLCAESLTDAEIGIDSTQIYSYMQNTCFSSEYIDSIYLYNSKTDYVISSIGSSFVGDFPDNELFSSNFPAENKSYLVFRNVNLNDSQKKYLSFYSSAAAYSYPAAMIVYNIDCGALPEVLYSGNEFIDRLYIIDSSENILYSNDGSAIAKAFSEYSSQKNMIMCNPISSFKIAFTYNYTDNFSKSYLSMIIIYTIFTLVLLSFSIYLISKRYLNAYVDLINILEADGGEYEQSDNELQYLLKNVRTIVSRNSNFEAEFAAQYKKLKNSQAITLQSQIKPHFIFNVLNTISLIDVKQNSRPTDITKIINALSDILRSLMNSDKYIIPFERELSYVDKYLTLQNIKYNNKFNFITHIDPDTLEIPIIKFTLQPIIENAIIHGILKLSETKGDIFLKSYLTEEKLIIEISNTGNPIAPEVLKKINDSFLNNIYPTNKHIGLLNVNNRIKLVFGDDYGCHIAHSGNITTVTLTFPKEQ